MTPEMQGEGFVSPLSTNDAVDGYTADCGLHGQQRDDRGSAASVAGLPAARFLTKSGAGKLRRQIDGSIMARQLTAPAEAGKMSIV
jgi:hypothetical protein